MEIDADPGAAVFLVVSGRTAPVVLNGSLLAADAGILSVALGASPEAPLFAGEPATDTTAASPDRREDTRYPTWLDASVYSRAYPAGQVAVITDLSQQGASVEVDTWESDAFFRLVFEVNDELLQIECECVHHEPTWRGVLLHTRFVLMDPEQLEILDTVVTALRSIFGVAQESLATDRIGSLLV